jgi:hypothetical protein
MAVMVAVRDVSFPATPLRKQLNSMDNNFFGDILF